MNQPQNQHKSKLEEGLRRSDLKYSVDHLFTIDQYQSKMGDDKDIITLRFRASSKEPAIDLMEFIEKGYEFVLDADVSSGEEKDGKYSIFVEIQRNNEAPQNIKELLNGLGQLCDIKSWRFRWYKDIGGHDFDEQAIKDFVPLSSDEYQQSIEGEEAQSIAEFFDQSALESISVDNEKNITFNKTYSEPLTAKLIAIGEYDVLKNILQGGLQLDESSQGQVLYLNKYLGNYDINKIENHFLIRNGTKAVILAKNTW